MPEDWKDYLREEEREALEWLLHETRKLMCAYKEARDVKNAELWSALIVLVKKIRELEKAIGKVEKPLKAIVEVGEAEKRKAIERLVREIMKPTDKESEEATQKLIESLMEF